MSKSVRHFSLVSVSRSCTRSFPAQAAACHSLRLRRDTRRDREREKKRNCVKIIKNLENQHLFARPSRHPMRACFDACTCMMANGESSVGGASISVAYISKNFTTLSPRVSLSCDDLASQFASCRPSLREAVCLFNCVLEKRV